MCVLLRKLAADMTLRAKYVKAGMLVDRVVLIVGEGADAIRGIR